MPENIKNIIEKTKAENLEKVCKKFGYVQKMIEELRATSSTIEKVNIIKKYCVYEPENVDVLKKHNDEKFDLVDFAKSVLYYTYHPLKHYNVTSDNIKKNPDIKGSCEVVTYGCFFGLLDDLSRRNVTGHDAIASVNLFTKDIPEFKDIIYCVIDKDLKTRASDKIINKAIPDLIPEFSVALAEKYDPKLVDWDKDWYVSRKIDGVRCFAFVSIINERVEYGEKKHDYQIDFRSRAGNTFDTLDVVKDGIKALGLKKSDIGLGVVLDGELCLVDENGNEDFQGVMKELRKKDHTIPNPSFKIFDMLKENEFWSNKGNNDRPFSARLSDLKKIMENNTCPCLSVLEQEKIKDNCHFEQWVSKSTQNNWEGLMLRADKPYKGKRSKDLLKYKSFFDDEYEVIDVEMGPFRYVSDGQEAEEEMLSCVTIQHKGHQVRVGSGFSIEQRQEFYQDPQKIIGKVITVQYFAESNNQEGGTSLRFPTFKYLHGDRRST
jgi:DNA ligase-1